MNIFVIRAYFRITKLQDVVSTYRFDLFKPFQSKYYWEHGISGIKLNVIEKTPM
jgi:hypothetical protein